MADERPDDCRGPAPISDPPVGLRLCCTPIAEDVGSDSIFEGERTSRCVGSGFDTGSSATSALG